MFTLDKVLEKKARIHKLSHDKFIYTDMLDVLTLGK